MKQRDIPILASIFAVTLLVALAPSAAASPATIVGSWETTTVNDEGRENVIYETFHLGGTALVSGNTRESGGGHGAWKRMGPRTYVAKYIILIFDQSGALLFKVTTVNNRQVSADGDSADGVSSSVVETPDGVVVATDSKTFTSERIKP